MKTATVTWISYNNYGTILQAYALQKKVEDLGFENTIISDAAILREFRKQHGYKDNKKQKADKKKSRSIRRVIKSGRLRRYYLSRTDRKKYEAPFTDSEKKCEAFKKECIKTTDCKGKDDLPALNNDNDVFIAGSDQIWSVLDVDLNTYYLLDFVTKGKISYAPSLGSTRIPKEMEGVFSSLLESFSSISVREKISCDQLRKIMGKQIEWVADPTLLFDREFWSRFAGENHPVKRKYILCYFLEDESWYFTYAEKAARKLHCELVLIPNIWDFLGRGYVIDQGIGPKEFVALFKNASFILTDSYHGSIFSLIFEKEFRYLQRFSDDDPNSQNIRIESLYEFLDLERIIVKGADEAFIKTELDYRHIRTIIEQFRIRSSEFLKDSLEKAGRQVLR